MGRIESELPRHAAAGGNHIDLLIAVVLSGEGDPLSIGRKLRKHFNARMGRQPDGRPTSGWRGPKVAGVSEDYAVAVDVGKAQQLCLGMDRVKAEQPKDECGEKE